MNGLSMAASILEQQTKEYWQISNAVMGRRGKITVAEAIDRTNTLTWHLGPSRALGRFVRCLSDVVIEGKRSKKQQPATISILKAAQHA